MEIRAGRLFDLGPDGLGFVSDTENQKTWAFHYPSVNPDLAPSAAAFMGLDNRQVRYSVERGQLVAIWLEAETSEKPLRAYSATAG